MLRVVMATLAKNAFELNERAAMARLADCADQKAGEVELILKSAIRSASYSSLTAQVIGTLAPVH